MKIENFKLSSSKKVTLLVAVIFLISSQAVIAENNQLNHTHKIGNQTKVEIRKQEEKLIKMKDKQHHKQLKNLIKQYQDSAKIVAEQGGNAKPLLDAAAYFQGQL
jgi:VIT1/CCC1 family predicted Fe2+/Mn2+ transporter